MLAVDLGRIVANPDHHSRRLTAEAAKLLLVPVDLDAWLKRILLVPALPATDVIPFAHGALLKL